MRHQLKVAAEGLIVASGVERAARARMNDSVLVLAYHNVVPDGRVHSGVGSLHLPLRDFVQQLDLIERTHEVVSLDSLTGATHSSTRPRVVITFDDAYEGTLGLAVQELKRRGMPATIFVAPGLLGRVAWWDALADPVSGLLDDALRVRMLSEFKGRTDEVLDWMKSSPAFASRDLTSLARVGSEQDVAAAAAVPGITLGSHSWSHANLNSLSGEDLANELTSPLSWLRQRFSSVVEWFGYPYGYGNAEVQAATAAAGYSGGFAIEGGWISRESFEHPFFLPRLGVPAGVTSNGFRLRLAGLKRT